MRILVRFVLNGLAILVAAFLIDGIVINGVGAALIAGAILGLVNAIVRPVLVILTLPFTIVTLGLFIFVVNALCLVLTAALVPGFEVHGVLSAIAGAFVVSLVSWFLNILAKEQHTRD